MQLKHQKRVNNHFKTYYISLKYHPSFQGQGGIFACNQCWFRTINRDAYINHVQDHHNGLIPEDGEAIAHMPFRKRAPRAKPMRTEVTMYPGRSSGVGVPVSGQNIMEILAQPVVPGTQHVIQVPVSTMGGQHMAQLQVDLEDPNTSSSGADMQRMNILDNLNAPESETDAATANLIYSALSAISLQSNDQFGIGLDPQDLVSKVESGDIQTSIETNSNKDGVTTHTITFHLPETGELLGGVTLQESAEEKDASDVTLLVEGDDNEWTLTQVEDEENS